MRYNLILGFKKSSSYEFNENEEKYQIVIMWDK